MRESRLKAKDFRLVVNGGLENDVKTRGQRRENTQGGRQPAWAERCGVDTRQPVNFFQVTPRQEYANYAAEYPVGDIDEKRIFPPHRQVAGSVEEYLGDPPRKPGKRGDIHITASSYYLRLSVVPIFEGAARGKMVSKPVIISGREMEAFVQIWVLNFVDCLDLGATISAPPGSLHKKFHMLGVIKKPVFDESRWDGSDLFVVPQDSGYNFYCTERFLDRWCQAKLRGAKFSRFLFDPKPVLA